MAALKRIAFTCEQIGDKVTLEDMLDRYSAKQNENIKQIVRGEISTRIDSKISDALAPINERLKKLEQGAGGTPRARRSTDPRIGSTDRSDL